MDEDKKVTIKDIAEMFNVPEFVLIEQTAEEKLAAMFLICMIFNKGNQEETNEK